MEPRLIRPAKLTDYKYCDICNCMNDHVINIMNSNWLSYRCVQCGHVTRYNIYEDKKVNRNENPKL